MEEVPPLSTFFSHYVLFMLRLAFKITQAELITGTKAFIW